MIRPGNQSRSVSKLELRGQSVMNNKLVLGVGAVIIVAAAIGIVVSQAGPAGPEVMSGLYRPPATHGLEVS